MGWQSASHPPPLQASQGGLCRSSTCSHQAMLSTAPAWLVKSCSWCPHHSSNASTPSSHACLRYRAWLWLPPQQQHSPTLLTRLSQVLYLAVASTPATLFPLTCLTWLCPHHSSSASIPSPRACLRYQLTNLRRCALHWDRVFLFQTVASNERWHYRLNTRDMYIPNLGYRYCVHLSHLAVGPTTTALNPQSTHVPEPQAAQGYRGSYFLGPAALTCFSSLCTAVVAWMSAWASNTFMPSSHAYLRHHVYA